MVCDTVRKYRRFGRTSCLHCIFWNMEASSFLQTSAFV
jgi:hypothetical protein